MPQVAATLRRTTLTVLSGSLLLTRARRLGYCRTHVALAAHAPPSLSHACFHGRTRASQAYGGAAASIGPAKQRRIVMTTALFLQRHREYARCRVRFDVLIVRDGQVEWLKHAFDA